MYDCPGKGTELDGSIRGPDTTTGEVAVPFIERVEYGGGGGSLLSPCTNPPGQAPSVPLAAASSFMRTRAIISGRIDSVVSVCGDSGTDFEWENPVGNEGFGSASASEAGIATGAKELALEVACAGNWWASEGEAKVGAVEEESIDEEEAIEVGAVETEGREDVDEVDVGAVSTEAVVRVTDGPLLNGEVTVSNGVDIEVNGELSGS